MVRSAETEISPASTAVLAEKYGPFSREVLEQNEPGGLSTSESGQPRMAIVIGSWLVSLYRAAARERSGTECLSPSEG